METKKVTGKIDNLWKPKDGKLWLVQLEQSEERYSGFGSIPDILHEAHLKGNRVELEYVDKEVNGKIYHNYKGARVIVLEGEKEEKNTPSPQEKKEEPFKSADKIDIAETILDMNAFVISGCYKRIKDMLGEKPNKDGEFAMVNTLFINSQRMLKDQRVWDAIKKKIGGDKENEESNSNR